MATKRVYNPPKAIKRGYAPQMATKRVYVPKRIRPWLMAARPKTLAGAVAPVLVGVACAGVFKPLPVALCLLFAVMMQVTANFVNDLVDYRRGNDDEGRLGPVRACQAGLIRPEAMQRGIVVSTILSCLVGLPLVLWGGWPMLLVGVACVLFCFLYSTLLAGRGGGDVLVVVFFGLVPVCVTAYVLTGVLADWRTVCLALAMGLATDTLLIVNNYRDLLQDRAHGKRTLCVWLGKRGSERLHLAMGGVATFVACLALAPKKWIILTPYIIMHISNNKQLRRYGQTTMQNLVLGRTAMAILLFALLTVAVSAWAQTYPISPVPFTSVSVTPQTFWGQRLQASREVTIPLAFSKCESEGRYRNFEIAARQLKGEDTSDVKVKGYSFDDTDVFKTIEGASYILQTYPDRQLEAYIDSVLAIVATAQEPDGYLYTARTMNPAHPHDWAGKERWVKVEDLSHEFYNLGHMVEGAIAHYQATGKRTFLDIAMRYADCVCRSIGEGEGQSIYVPGHQIAEMALA